MYFILQFHLSDNRISVIRSNNLEQNDKSEFLMAAVNIPHHMAIVIGHPAGYRRDSLGDIQNCFESVSR